MTNEVVPEIHDIGKLIDKKSTGINHTFYSYPGDLKHLPVKNGFLWQTIEQHHCSFKYKDEDFPRSKETFILCIADYLASVVSRHDKTKNSGFNVFKLWKSSNGFKNLSESVGVQTGSKKWVEKIVNFVNGQPNANNFLQEFEYYLKNRCEDTKTNITSLYTHSLLTGKFYRLLLPLKDDIKEIDWTIKEQVCNELNSQKEEWTLNIIKVRVNFYQKIYRAKDMNIFKLINEFIGTIKSKFDDSFIFSTTNEVVLAVLNKDHFISELQDILKNYPLWLEVESMKFILQERKELSKEIKEIVKEDPRVIYPDPKIVLNYIGLLERALKSKIEKKLKNDLNDSIPPSKREIIKENIVKSISNSPLQQEINYLKESYYEANLYPHDLQSKISTPICDICQMYPAEKYELLTKEEVNLVTDSKTGIVEHLCEKCISIRKKGESLEKLSKWEDTSVMWVKITLNFNMLTKILEELYSDYLKNYGYELNVRPSLVTEFQWDFDEFLNCFHRKISDEFKENKLQVISDDLYCIKIEELRAIIRILKVYNDLITKFFPKFRETTESPIKLVISESYVKFPFFEHWKYLSHPKNDIDIKLVTKGEMKISLDKLDDLLKLNLGNKTALHKLAKMAEFSKQLAYMEIVSKEGIRDHPDLWKALSNKHFEISDILTYIKIGGA